MKFEKSTILKYNHFIEKYFLMKLIGGDVMKIGDRMKRLREEKGLIQQDVCNALDIEQSTLANYENNRRIPKTDILIAIANFYGVSLDYLVGRTNIKTDIPHRPKDLNKFLQQSEIIFDGDTYNLTNDERDMVMKSLEVAFYAAKQANKKRKKGDTPNK
jgi:transcriptional regulator with XRE-family HTH domain